MPQNKSYEDHDAQSGGIVSEFFCWFFMVSIGFPTQIGWVLNAWFGMSGVHLLELSAGLGVLGGFFGVKESYQSERKKALRNNTQSILTLVVDDKERQPNPAPIHSDGAAVLHIVREEGNRGYGG